MKKFEKKTWNEFRESGFLWLVNSILHMFGWAIVLDIDDACVDVYPARVSVMGFPTDVNTLGYKKIRKYMADNATALLEEASDD